MTDLFADDPMSHPLTYPGRLPQTSGLLVSTRFVPLISVEQEPVEQWRIDADGQSAALAEYLKNLSAAPLDARHRVVAIGSNAAPGQLYRKLTNCGISPVVPLTLADVHGIAPGVSAHINRHGYVPAAPIFALGEVSRLFVLWVDDVQLEALDATEPNYHRCPLSREFPVILDSGISASGCHIYIGNHGHLIDPSGAPLRLGSQKDVILRLLSRSEELQRLCGTSPEEFVSRVKEESVRKLAYALFRAEGFVSTA